MASEHIPTAPTAAATVHGRVGLLGNPGDGYGGRVLAFTVAEMACTVTAEPARQTDVGTGDEARLFSATLNRFAPHQPVRLRMTTTIARQVGLSGSSAIILATLRALCMVDRVVMSPVELARMALEIETDQLGITAGPQDRVVQAHGGLLDMDFATPWDTTAYHRLDPTVLPPGLFLAWDTDVGQPSDAIHRPVREQWDQGEAEVRRLIGELRELATQGAAALLARDTAMLAELMDSNFDIRAQLWPIAESDQHKINLARSLGAAAKFCGSGGAIVGLMRPGHRPDGLETVRSAFEGAGFGFCAPTVGVEHS